MNPAGIIAIMNLDVLEEDPGFTANRSLSVLEWSDRITCDSSFPTSDRVNKRTSSFIGRHRRLTHSGGSGPSFNQTSLPSAKDLPSLAAWDFPAAVLPTRCEWIRFSFLPIRSRVLPTPLRSGPTLCRVFFLLTLYDITHVYPICQSPEPPSSKAQKGCTSQQIRTLFPADTRNN